MRRAGMLAVAAVAMLLTACSDRTTTGDRLVGTWLLSAYEDHGEPASTTGTWSFWSDASFSVLGTITFSGEPADSLDVIGTWMEQGPSAIAMTVVGETTIWDVALATDTAVLILPDETGAVRITLTR
jgi:hypothetical protein